MGYGAAGAAAHQQRERGSGALLHEKSHTFYTVGLGLWPMLSSVQAQSLLSSASHHVDVAKVIKDFNRSRFGGCIL